MHLAVLVVQWRQKHWPLSAWVRASTIIPLLSLCLLSIGVVGLVCIDHEATHLLLFMLSVSVSVVGLSLGWRASVGKRGGEFDREIIVNRGDEAW